MGIDKDYYTLYSIAMQEARHHHRLYTEIWLAAIFLGGVFFSAFYFLARVILTPPFNWFTIVFGCLIIGTFYWVCMRRGVIANHCRKIAKKLEHIIAGKRQDDTLDDLLVTDQIEVLIKQRRHVLRLVFWCPWVFFVIALLVLWVLLCLTPVDALFPPG